MPTADEVVALMVGDGSEVVDRRDVIIAQQIGPFQRISELHVGYMALHYPLLFPYGEDGWHLNIPLNGVVVQDVDAHLDEDHAKESEHKKTLQCDNGRILLLSTSTSRHRWHCVALRWPIEVAIHCGCLCGY